MKNSMKKISQRITHGVVMACIIFGCSAYPQISFANSGKEIQQAKITVKGTIADESGEPLIGVSVVEKGTTNGTVTDLDGKFSISVSNTGSVLTISYVGYSPQDITVGNQTSFDIVLKEDAKMLDEVFVVAYGTAKKASFTGSATVVGADIIDKVQPANISQGLQGLSPGLQVINGSGAPGADATIMIRGLGSITASNDPLIVVDGIAYGGALNTIAPSEIESITVLKDAASTTLYGSRAGNGVILITTKKGKSGKTQINLRANWGTSDFAVKFPKRSSPERQYELTFEGLYNDAMDFMKKSDGTAYTDSEARQYAHDNVSRIYWDAANVTLADGTFRKYLSDWNTDYPVGLDGKIKSDAKRLYNYDVYDEAFEKRLKQDYSVDISGALGDKNTYFATVSLLDDKGIYVGEQYKRANTRFQISSKIREWLTMENSIAYITSTDHNVSTPFRAFRNFPTVYSAFIWDHDTNDYAISPYTGDRILDVGEQGRAWWKGWSAFGYLVEKKKNKTDQVFAKSSLNIQILPFLSYRASYGYDYISNFNHWYRSPERGTNLKPGDGLVDRSGRRYAAHTFNNFVTFDKKFDQHSVNVLAGAEAYMWNSTDWSSGRRNLSMVGMNEQSSASGAATAYSWSDKYRLASFLSRVEYDYSDKYYITASYRKDGSSRFHKDNRWGDFYSAGASWRISEEEFMKPTSDWLSNLKLRLSYGAVGNDGLETLYAYQSLYETSNYFGASGVVLSKFYTPEVKWEKNIQTNLGLEFTLFDKVQVTAELYKRKSKDLLYDKNLPYSLGKTSYIANIGDVENNGWELDIRYQAVRTKDFEWQVGFNASGYKNEITYLPSDEVKTDYAPLTNIWKVGGSLYDIYAPVWAGVDPNTGRNTWYKYTYDSDGRITNKEVTSNRADVTSTAQYQKVGSSLPDVYGSLTNSFRYRDFDLSFMIYYSFGAQYYDYHYAESSRASGANASTKFTEGRWQKVGDVTSVPKIYAEKEGDSYGAAYSSQYVFDNDFLRLRNLTIGYNLPKHIISKWGIGGIRVFAIGENLYTTGDAKKKGTDPENVGLAGRVDDYAGLPIRKTYNLGINIQF